MSTRVATMATSLAMGASRDVTWEILPHRPATRRGGILSAHLTPDAQPKCRRHAMKKLRAASRRACISLAQEAFRPPDPSTPDPSTQWGYSNLTFMGKRWYLERTILSKRTSRSKTLPCFCQFSMVVDRLAGSKPRYDRRLKQKSCLAVLFHEVT